MFALLLRDEGRVDLVMIVTLSRDSALLSLSDAYGVDNLVVVPWAHSVLVHAELCARAAEEIGQVLLVYDREEVALVAASLDGDLRSRLLVEEALDHRPHATEKHRCIHDEGLAHDLRVVVRAHFGGQLDQGVNLLGKNLHGASVEIEDVEALLDASASDGRAGGESESHEDLIGNDVVLYKSLLVRVLHHLIDF